MRLIQSAIAVSFFFVVTLVAQVGTEASFFGTALDSSGASVPNATVTATNLSTGLTKTVQSDNEGSFNILALPIGPYSLTVAANGFKKWELPMAELRVGDRYRVEATLQVGDVRDTVSVTTSSGVLQTETAATETVVQMQQIRELPLANRNPLALVALVPGMRVDSQQTGQERATFVQGNGLRNNKTAFQLDGVNSNAPSDEGGAGIPNVDTIAEFSVQTANFSAESGRDPMQVLVVTKSGSNQFHGTAWEFLQNDFFNARKTFATTKDRVRYNQFGAQLGGPILHNKTFFFGSFQGTVTRNASVYNSLAVTPAMKNGDFGALSKQIRNPFAGGVPFPANRIPANLLNPASKYFLPYILEANSPGNFYRGNVTAPNNTWEGTLRIDHQITDAQRIYGRYVTARQPRTVLGGTSPLYPGTDEIVQHNLGLNYSWTLSPRTLLIASGGTFRTNETYSNPAIGVQNDDEKAGIQGFPTTGREAWIGPPDLTFGNGYTGLSFPGGYGVPGTIYGNTYNAKVALNRIQGNHTLGFGFEYGDWRALAQHGSAAPRGSFSFNNLYSNDGFADYLLGLPSATSRNDPLKNFGADRAPYNAYYVNDSWRVRQNLTLTLGLRYERWLAHHNVGNVASTWDPDIKKMVLAVDSNGNPNLTAYPVTPALAAATTDLWTTARKAGIPDGLYEPNGNWAPRLGIVYRPSERKDIVLRAGYGLFYNSYTGNRAASMLNVPHWSSESQSFGTGTLQNWQTAWSNDPSKFGTFQVYSPLYNIRPARTKEWNVSLQTGLPFKTALTLSYVGTIVGNEIGGNELNEATVGPHTSIQADRPNPRFAGIHVYQNFARSWYHGLQTKAERRFADGLTFSFAYSFSRSMGQNFPNGEFDALLPYSPDWYNRGRTPTDFRQIEYATMVWELPVGRSKKYLAGMDRGLDAFLGGWQLAFTEQARSGQPLGITGGTNNLGNGWGSRADLVGDPGLANPSPTQWFNTSAFAVPAAYRFGSSAFGVVEGPGLFYVSTSLSKNFKFNESRYVQFRCDAFNIQNRANFSNPSTTKTAGNFGQITGSGDARFLQLAVKLFF